MLLVVTFHVEDFIINTAVSYTGIMYFSGFLYAIKVIYDRVQVINRV